MQVFPVSEKLYIGLTGLASDVLSLRQLLAFRSNMYKLREHREMKPEAFSALVSTMLYEKRYVRSHILNPFTWSILSIRCVSRFYSFGPWFCEPVIAGLDAENKPFLSGMDLIGAPVFTDDFVVCGTCTSNLHGTCEALYRKDMEPEDLFEVLSQCLLASMDRDALSGWGAVVHIM